MEMRFEGNKFEEDWFAGGLGGVQSAGHFAYAFCLQNAHAGLRGAEPPLGWQEQEGRQVLRIGERSVVGDTIVFREKSYYLN